MASSGIGCLAGGFSLLTAAEMIACDYGLTRQDLYAFALGSYREETIVPVRKPHRASIAWSDPMPSASIVHK